MPNIVKELSLNKHPKDCKDYSLINARNIQVSNDFSCLQNEYSITKHEELCEFLEDKIIVGWIPCNTEVVLFVCDYNYDWELGRTTDVVDCTIVRWDEEVNEYFECCICKYHGGIIKGTFTYNVSKDLIIAFAESDSQYVKDIPLRTINLGKFDDSPNYTDRELDAGLHAASPELKIPSLSDFNYISGNTYKGWYYFFIRYKINSNDYTHWFPFGHPIFICDIEKQSIFKYGFKVDSSQSYNITGALDYFSSKSEIANETVNINIDNLDTRYKYYQIGFICVAKDTSKAFRTDDINIKNTFSDYTVLISESNSYDINQLILDNYNYYNVRNVINYQNRLYIANYKEYTKPNIQEQELGRIHIKCKFETIKIDDYSYQTIAIQDGNVISKEVKSIDTSSGLNEYVTIDKYPVYRGSLFTGKVGWGTFWIPRSTQFPYEEVGTIDTSDGGTIAATLSAKFTSLNNGELTITALIGDKSYICKYTIYADGRNMTSYGVSPSSNDFDTKIVVSGSNTIINSKPYFINTNNSFNKRKRESTLLPGEVYAFYIHFVNKYGEASEGYFIPNRYGEQELRTIWFEVKDSSNHISYLEFPYNQNVFNDDGTVNTDNMVINGYNMSVSDATQALEDAVSSMKGITNIKWFQVPNIDYPPIGTSPFIPFENSNGDILYKVPHFDFETDGSTTTYNLCKFEFDLGNFNLPDGYIGYYFSYEKFEPTCKFKGILTKKDISNQTAITDQYTKFNGVSINDLNTVNFYCSNLDIDDNLDLELNTLHVIKELNLYDSQVSYDGSSNREFANAKYAANLNKPELSVANESINKLYNIDKFNLSLANDVFKDKLDGGTSIEIDVTNEIKSLFTGDKYYKVNLLNLTTNLYTSKNKVLIKFTDIYYNETSGIVSKGLNGHFTYNGTLVYDFNKFIVDATNIVVNEKYYMYYKTDVVDENTKKMSSYRAPLYYVQLYTYDTEFNESKSFKVEPQIYSLRIDEIDENNPSNVIGYARNLIVLPLNSVDLFENRYPNQDSLNPKTFTNFDINNQYIEEFTKRVRRSAVISDESNENSWRIFPLEQYKDISENKGDITNLVGIGTTFLIHTQHSLFMFDRDNVLQTNDKNVQLSMPDTFDMQYKEVLTSELGMCGLQDRKAWIADSFGYIFYDNDAHRFYKFGQGKIDNIDYDIIQFLNKYKPVTVRFANDKESNRLLLTIEIDTVAVEVESSIYKKLTLSYNYAINKWISFHDYTFDEAFNTKGMLYMHIVYDMHDINEELIGKYSKLFIINNANNSRINVNAIENQHYGEFENTKDNKVINPNSRIDIICNSEYEVMKYLEYLIYKLYKIDKDTNSYEPFPVEKLLQPYSGKTIRIYNHDVDTGVLDILIDNLTTNSKKNFDVKNHNKPWWELGNWNFNYIRDNSRLTQSDSLYPSRLYGNYFVISFEMNDSSRRIEFESLTCILTKDKR